MREFDKADPGTLYGFSTTLLVSLVSVTAITNCVADYISLNKTRLLLKYCETANGWRLSLLFALDTFLTPLIYSACFYLAVGLADIDLRAFRHPIVLLSDAYTVITGNVVLTRIFLIATFGASLMFYAFLLSTFLVRLLGLLRSRLMILLERLEASDNLFKSVGAVLGGFLALGKGIGELVRALTG